MKLTPFRRKALEVIRDNPGITAGDLALQLWPDANMHHRVSNQGHGACHGKAAWLCGGSYAKKLVYDGLVRDAFVPGGLARGYWITYAGADAIK